MTTKSELLDAALAYSAQGRAVIAVTKDKTPYHKGWTDFFGRRQTAEEVKCEFSNGAHGIAILLWPASPYLVLDFDGPHAEEAWQQTGIELPDTARNQTRSGGSHRFFKMPHEVRFEIRRQVRLVKARCSCAKVCGVDLLVHGYAIIPPTPGYTEDPDHPLEDAVVIPAKILSLSQVSPRKKDRLTGDSDGRVSEGERHNVACSLAGTMRQRGMSIEAIRAGLKTDTEARFDPPLDAAEIEGIVKSAATWPAGETGKIEHFTDLGNACRLVRLHGQDLRFSKQLGWLIWDGLRWAPDDSGAVDRLAKATVRSIYNEAAHCEDEDLRPKIAGHARSSESEMRIKAMIGLAKTEAAIAVRPNDLDRDPWLLNLKNGTLNLRTAELYPHKREDLITRVISQDYSPESPCLTWRKFLEQITAGDQELMQFLQKAVGYSLSGNTREQCLFILYGTGANGKSTFLNIVSCLMGEYAKQTRSETLMIKRGDQIPNDVARLAGARFVSAVETENARRLAESLVKQMTGGDRMTARFLHREFFEFDPEFKLWLAVNHKPKITGTDHAIWRRVRLVPFGVTIPESKRDPDLGEKLKQELPGILTWAVAGCRLWQAEGIKSPKAIEAATCDYRSESDTIATFLDECCRLGPSYEVSKGELYQAYMEWCKKSGEVADCKREFGTKLTEKGFGEGRTKSTRTWKGIKLSGDATAKDDGR